MATYDGMSTAKPFAQLRERLKRYARDVPIHYKRLKIEFVRVEIADTGRFSMSSSNMSIASPIFQSQKFFFSQVTN